MATELAMKTGDALAEVDTADVTNDSSAQGAAMLIRLKEGVGYVYAVPQGHIAEMARAEVQGLQPDQQEQNAGEAERDTTSDSVTFTGSTSVAIQANDYEIERRSGLVPARRRLIPFKFRDFQTAEETGEDPGDLDYDPEEAAPSVKRVRRVARPGARSVGRPRKVRKDHAYDRAGQEKGDRGSGDGPDTQSTEEQITTDEKTKKKAADRPFPRRGRPPKDDPYTQPKVFKCLQCDKRFSLKGNLKVHIRTHTDERPFKCDLPECQKAFRSNESLRRHTLSHQGIKMFGCDICEKRFSSNVALKEHIARHTDTKSQVCPVCNRAFRQLSCLRRHMTTHTSDQPHQCKMCDKRFSQAVYLRSHMRSHTGERPYKCSTCQKAFAHQSDMTRHMTIHLGTKPYVCEVCEARFSDPSTRRRHVREHTGYKPYTCQLCGDTFKRSGQLKAHLNKKHMNYKDDVVISKAGRFNSLQFQFKGNPNTGVAEQLAAAAGKDGPSAGPTEGQVTTISEDQVMRTSEGQVVHIPQGQVVTLTPGQNQVQIIDEHGQIQHLQVQQIDSSGQVTQNQMLGQIQQQLVEAGFNQSQLDGNQIILAQTNNQDELSEETQKIIQQIQSQLDPSGEAGVAYQILHDDDNQQIVEIQYHTLESRQEAMVALVEGQEDGVGSQQGPTRAHPAGAVTVQGEKGQDLIQQPKQDGQHGQNDYQQDEQQPQQYDIQQDDIQHQQHIYQQDKQQAEDTHYQVQPQSTESSGQVEHSTQQVSAESQAEHYTQRVSAEGQVEHYTQRVSAEGQPEHYTQQVPSPNIAPLHSRDSMGNEGLLNQAHQTAMQSEGVDVTIQEVQEPQDPPGAQGGDTAVGPAEGIVEGRTVEVPDQETEGGETLGEEAPGGDCEEATLLTLQTLEQQQQQASVDYVTNPNFNCQEYYNWLSNFTELCKLVPMPLDVDLFQKISQVHKTLSDVLATPRGILTNRENFRTLMNISKELNNIINKHLNFVLHNLDTDMNVE